MTLSIVSKALLVAATALAVQGRWSAVAPSDSGALPDTRWSRDCIPNYAAAMLPPSDEVGCVPELVAEWSHWPLRVAVLDDGRFATPDLVGVVQRACRSWEIATKGVPEGGVSFLVRAERRPMGADVVVEFCRPEDIGGFKGFTRERDGWIHVRIACKDRSGADVGQEKVLRCVTHELGHVLGIWGHSPDPRDAMSLDERPCEISIADVNTLRLAYRKR
jgi:hypothetical protein